MYISTYINDVDNNYGVKTYTCERCDVDLQWLYYEANRVK